MSKLRVYQPRPNHYEFIERYRDDFERFPRMDNATYFMKYVIIALKARLTGRRVSDREIFAAKRQLLSYLRREAKNTEEYALYEKGLEEIWDNIATRMRRNPAVLEYFLDFATKSVSLANFMSWVPCSETMENARGYGYDIAGRYGQLDLDDIAFYWSLRTPVLAEICLRIQYFQEVLETMMIELERKSPGEKLRLEIVGAGRLAELRSYAAELDWFNNLEIIAIDEDSGVRSNIDDLFRYKYQSSLEELGFIWADRSMSEAQIDELAKQRNAKHRYYNMSFDEFRKKSEYNGYFDLILCDGIMSYYKRSTSAMLSHLRTTMKDSGKLIFDLQILNLPGDMSLLQHKEALNWETVPRLDPDFSVNGAYKRIQKACDAAGLAMEDAVIYPADSAKNAVKIGVGFTLTRQANWSKTGN